MRLGAIVIAALTVSLSAFAADPFVGTWKLNEQKSKVSSGELPKGRTNVYTAAPDGLRISIQDEGGKATDQVALIMDGKEHPVSSSPLVRTVGADTSVLLRPNSNEIVVTFKRHGKQVATMKREVSKDGRQLTATGDGVSTTGDKFHNVFVYDKQ